MEPLFTIILITHAVAGGVALLTGGINMLRKKGTIAHAKIGLVYFYSVLINSFCAFFLSVYHPNLFLFSLAVLSFYLVYTGRGYLLKSKIKGAQIAKPIDWLLNSGLLCFGLLLTTYSFYNLYVGRFNFIPLVFGLFSIYLSAPVLIRLRIKPIKTTSEGFFKAHIASMVGSYTTIFSAFLVVNNHGYFPVWLGWFGPAIIFVPFIRIWKRKYPAE